MLSVTVRSYAAALFAAAVLFVVGCGSPLTQSNYEKIKTGMSKSEVEAILGKGKEQGSSSTAFGGVTMNAESLIWQEGDPSNFKMIVVMFVNDKVQGKSQAGF